MSVSMEDYYDNENIWHVLLELKKGNINAINPVSIKELNRVTILLLNDDISTLNDPYGCYEIILEICNILWNNTDRNMMPIEDGIYDLLLEKFKSINPNWQVGAEPIYFAPTDQRGDTIINKEMPRAMKRLDPKKEEDMLFIEELSSTPKPFISPRAMTRQLDEAYISKRNVNIKHNYPKLVGTLDKCKFVLNSQAQDKGVFNDNNVQVVERDFFGKHIQSGILEPKRKIRVLLSIKYDGVSVEADVTNMVAGARTRGDANNDIAADLTPILYGYKFPFAPQEMWNQEPFGMKFEAIMTYYNLDRYNVLKGKEYKNARSAISGLFASSDAYKYRDLISLVPLATSLEGIDREEEIEFMNTFYNSGVYFKNSVVEGTYIEVLFQIKRFVEEAEMMRDYMGFLYDGVVIEYLDKDLIEKLGRVNSVNKYSIAVKFNPLKKQTTFIGFDYTVGEHGTITPQIYFTPVEFYGGIHDHTSGHSYERFKNLQLRVGDILDVEYVNDVMPYVTKPDNSNNANNPNPLVEFIHECPCCHTILETTPTGKNKYCPNIECPQRNLMRIVNMMKKLNLKDFSEAQLEKIGKYTLSDMLNTTLEEVNFLGDITASKFMDRMNQLKTESIMDYNLVGSIGIEGVGRRKWKLIFYHYTLEEIMSMDEHTLRQCIVNIKGMGPSSADTIVDKLEFFRNDIETILSMPNIISSKGMKAKKKIRITGFRDEDLLDYLESLGCDASDSSVTKDTDILLIPFLSYEQGSKIKKAAGYGVQIIAVQEFRDNMDKYI